MSQKFSKIPSIVKITDSFLATLPLSNKITTLGITIDSIMKYDSHILNVIRRLFLLLIFIYIIYIRLVLSSPLILLNHLYIHWFLVDSTTAIHFLFLSLIIL